jgi:hypothetical protein
MDTVHVGSGRWRVRPSWLASAPLVALVALVATACGNAAPPAGHGQPQSTSTPHAIVLASVQRTEAVDTAALSFDVSVSGTPSIPGLEPAVSGASATSVSYSITGNGVFDFRAKTGQMTFAVPAVGGSGGGTVEVRIIGTDLYLRATPLAALTGGKPWVHVDVQHYVKRQDSSAGPLGGFSDGDPTQVLGILNELSGDVTKVGTADVDGVPTTEYQGSIDLSGGAGPGGSTGSTLVSPQSALAFGLTLIPVDVWIDGAGRARRVETSFSAFGLTIKSEEGFGSFGTPVHVTPPPAADVADGTSLLDGGQLDNLFGRNPSSG